MNRLTLKMAITALCAVVACCTGNSKNQEKKGRTMNTKAEIYLAGGCFWGTEHYLKQIEGVTETQTGYANGHGKNPSYQEVCTDKTGFAEAVRVVYDPERLPLSMLLQLYFKSINPTSLTVRATTLVRSIARASITPTPTTFPSSKQRWLRWPNAITDRCKWRCYP